MSGTVSLPSVSQAALDAVAARIPAIPTAPPVAEARTAQVGNPSNYASENHTHPRLTSVSVGTLGAGGVSPDIMFTRSFVAQPGVVLTPVMPGGTQPVALQVQSWIKDASNNFVGCTVKGYRGQTLPNTLTLLSGLVAFDVNAGSASGVQFSVIAIQAS